MNLQWRWAALKNGFLDATAYRLEFLIEIIGSAAVPAVIQWVLWYAIYQKGGHQEIGGMEFRDMLHYTWMSILFSQVRGGNHDFELAELIRNGQLSNYLLRPVGPVEFIYIRGVAPRLFVACVALLGGGGAITRTGDFHSSTICCYGACAMWKPDPLPSRSNLGDGVLLLGRSLQRAHD